MDKQRLIIADSSPLIAMALLGLLEKLSSLADDVLVPDTVYHECTGNLSLTGAKAIKRAVERGTLTRCEDLDAQESPLLASIYDLVDAGEAQAIAIAQNMSGLLLIDDKAGRRCAKHHNIPVIGSIGTLLYIRHSAPISGINILVRSPKN